MKPWILATIGLLMFTPVPSSAAVIRGLFVGIDDYAFSRSKAPGAAFGDLKGAVGDTLRIKAALQQIYRLDLDTPQPGACQSENAVSVTLTDRCATREAILTALGERIARSAPGDTVLFYFAGHGSQYPDNRIQDQASGFNGTIMPTDARDPDGIARGDILDRELKAYKDRATTAGVNFVTIFDSCNSGTATRDGANGVSRSAPRLTAAPPQRVAIPQTRGPGGGYWVHLAAADDGEQAQEVTAGRVGERAGVYTTQLIATLQQIPDAAFADIAREAALKVGATGHTSQNPRAEGTGLSASLGGGARQGQVIGARFDGAVVELEAGSLSGVTEGSVFGYFAGRAEALSDAARPLATGKITLSDFRTSRMTLETPGATLPARGVVKELSHMFGPEIPVVDVKMASSPAREAVETALRGIPFVKRGAPGEVSVAASASSAGAVALLGADGALISELGRVDQSGFQIRLYNDLQKVARVQSLLALRTPTRPPEATLCVDDSAYDPAACPPLEGRGKRSLAVNRDIKVTISNVAQDINRGLYIYVLGIDPAYGVSMIFPPPGTTDPKVAPGRLTTNANDPFSLDAKGRYRFITLATDKPISVEALTQDGVGTRDGRACQTALERALCAANSGARSGATPNAGDWTASVTEAIVQ